MLHLFPAPTIKPRITQTGNSLIEVLLVIVLLGMLSIPLLLSINRINRNFTKLSILATANAISQRNLEIANHIAQVNWQQIASLHPGQAYHLQQTINGWQFQPGEQPQGVYTTQITVQLVCRDDQLKLTDCTMGQITDPNSRRLISTTSWLFDSQNHQSEQTLILTNLFNQQSDK